MIDRSPRDHCIRAKRPYERQPIGPYLPLPPPHFNGKAHSILARRSHASGLGFGAIGRRVWLIERPTTNKRLRWGNPIDRDPSAIFKCAGAVAMTELSYPCTSTSNWNQALLYVVPYSTTVPNQKHTWQRQQSPL